MTMETTKNQNAIKNVATTSVWTLDKSHSHLYFIARHMLISNVKGEFKDFDTRVVVPGTDIEAAKVDVTIDVNSLNTGVGDRDNHLRSADFFDAGNHGKATFKSTDINKLDDETFEIKGDLTIRDITKPVTLKAVFGGVIKDSWGNDRMGFEVTGKINRFDYDLKWNALLETGGAVVGQDIRIQADVELVKQADEKK
jgi:polyisoprenoid-binding protein YceI